MRIAFVLPYGERADGFFPDTLAGLLCARARALGHEANLVRVYYERGRDEEVRARLVDWLRGREIDLVVVERLFDGAPLAAHGGTRLLVTRGEPFEPRPPLDWVVGANPSPTSRGGRRSPEIGELVAAFEAFLADPSTASRVTPDGLEHGPPTRPTPLPRPAHPVLEQDVIALGPPPPIRVKTIFGNAGCPFAADPLDAPHFEGVRLPDAPLARLGCAFCPMGGDYQKRPDAAVVDELVEQAAFIAEGAPEVEALVLSDQHAHRYLAALMEAAADLRPMRWLFAARADAFVRERARIEAAVDVAARHGHVLETYLSGFESFSDAELARYGKGVDVATLLAAVDAMRALKRRSPRSFDYARARGHSLILFGPWTTLDDLRDNVSTIRAHGLGELFDEIGRNRLRLYADLPITWAAARDGLLREGWSAGDEGAGRAKGYSTELPWRFAHEATRRARALAEALRRALGTETELEQLAAAIEAAEGGPAALEGLDALQAVLRSATGGAHRGAVAVELTTCSSDLEARVDAAATVGGPVVLADRDRAGHPALASLARRVRATGRTLGLVTQAAAWAEPPLPPGVEVAAASVWRGDGAADARGWARLRERVGTLEARFSVGRDDLDDLPDRVTRAADDGADQVFFEVSLERLGLARLEAAAASIGDALRRARALGLAAETAPLRAGTGRFDRLPSARYRRRR